MPVTDGLLNFGTLVISATNVDVAGTSVDIGGGVQRGKAIYVNFLAAGVISSSTNTLELVLQGSPDNTNWYDKTVDVEGEMALTTTPTEINRYLPYTSDDRYLRAVARLTGGGVPTGTVFPQYSPSRA